ncbi:MAG: hypothetical protein ACI9LI_000982 [Saprospiraceae bacterium]|jgi:hypothetical protein
MRMNRFNQKPQYPLTYGDKVDDDEVRLSDFAVELMKSKKFQSYASAVFFAFLTLGSYAQPSSAIPPEYGEAAANLAQGVEQGVPPLGEVAGNINPHQNIPQIGNPGRVGLNQGGVGPNNNQHNFGQNGVPHKPTQPAWRIPGPPVNPGGQYANTLLLVGSVGWICLNASWGNPIFVYGCVGIVGGLVNELRKKCL